jgi:hypothetical protein
MTTAINTFGDARIDRLAADYLAAREAWHYRRDTPPYALKLDGRLTREAVQGRYVVATIMLAEALMKFDPFALAAGEGAVWDDGRTTLRPGEKRSIIITYSREAARD